MQPGQRGIVAHPQRNVQVSLRFRRQALEQIQVLLAVGMRFPNPEGQHLPDFTLRHHWTLVSDLIGVEAAFECELRFRKVGDERVAPAACEAAQYRSFVVGFNAVTDNGVVSAGGEAPLDRGEVSAKALLMDEKKGCVEAGDERLKRAAVQVELTLLIG
jgi:hypothetical protein